ncbi:hypothetical protein CAEBREN_05457 [Caenorhabditis brenneri]|uniref:Uncharacterized protein n=1 Tax=Caenorhabditis brenneri TaxID=135651 RepID=G0PDT3_CAEBE|nr:hypothetical protein CAEBREN_05457 [Caenorhabditis brenneri]
MKFQMHSPQNVSQRPELKLLKMSFLD